MDRRNWKKKITGPLKDSTRWMREGVYKLKNKAQGNKRADQRDNILSEDNKHTNNLNNNNIDESSKVKENSIVESISSLDLSNTKGKEISAVESIEQLEKTTSLDSMKAELTLEETVNLGKGSLKETVESTKNNFDKAQQDLDKYLASFKNEIREINKFTSYYKDIISCLKEDFTLRWRAERFLERENVTPKQLSDWQADLEQSKSELTNKLENFKQHLEARSKLHDIIKTTQQDYNNFFNLSLKESSSSKLLDELRGHTTVEGFFEYLDKVHIDLKDAQAHHKENGEIAEMTKILSQKSGLLENHHRELLDKHMEVEPILQEYREARSKYENLSSTYGGILKYWNEHQEELMKGFTLESITNVHNVIKEVRDNYIVKSTGKELLENPENMDTYKEYLSHTLKEFQDYTYVRSKIQEGIQTIQKKYDDAQKKYNNHFGEIKSFIEFKSIKDINACLLETSELLGKARKSLESKLATKDDSSSISEDLHDRDSELLVKSEEFAKYLKNRPQFQELLGNIENEIVKAASYHQIYLNYNLEQKPFEMEYLKEINKSIQEAMQCLNKQEATADDLSKKTQDLITHKTNLTKQLNAYEQCLNQELKNEADAMEHKIGKFVNYLQPECDSLFQGYGVVLKNQLEKSRVALVNAQEHLREHLLVEEPLSKEGDTSMRDNWNQDGNNDHDNRDNVAEKRVLNSAHQDSTQTLVDDPKREDTNETLVESASHSETHLSKKLEATPEDFLARFQELRACKINLPRLLENCMVPRIYSKLEDMNSTYNKANQYWNKLQDGFTKPEYDEFYNHLNKIYTTYKVKDINMIEDIVEEYKDQPKELFNDHTKLSDILGKFEQKYESARSGLEASVQAMASGTYEAWQYLHSGQENLSVYHTKLKKEFDQCNRMLQEAQMCLASGQEPVGGLLKKTEGLGSRAIELDKRLKDIKGYQDISNFYNNLVCQWHQQYRQIEIQKWFSQEDFNGFGNDFLNIYNRYFNQNMIMNEELLQNSDHLEADKAKLTEISDKFRYVEFLKVMEANIQKVQNYLADRDTYSKFRIAKLESGFEGHQQVFRDAEQFLKSDQVTHESLLQKFENMADDEKKLFEKVQEFDNYAMLAYVIKTSKHILPILENLGTDKPDFYNEYSSHYEEGLKDLLNDETTTEDLAKRFQDLEYYYNKALIFVRLDNSEKDVEKLNNYIVKAEDKLQEYTKQIQENQESYGEDKDIENNQEMLKQWKKFYQIESAKYQNQSSYVINYFKQQQVTTEGLKAMLDKLDADRLDLQNLKWARAFWERVERESPVPEMDQGPLFDPVVTDLLPKNLGSLFSTQSKAGRESPPDRYQEVLKEVHALFSESQVGKDYAKEVEANNERTKKIIQEINEGKRDEEPWPPEWQ